MKNSSGTPVQTTLFNYWHKSGIHWNIYKYGIYDSFLAADVWVYWFKALLGLPKWIVKAENQLLKEVLFERFRAEFCPKLFSSLCLPEPEIQVSDSFLFLEWKYFSGDNTLNYDLLLDELVWDFFFFLKLAGNRAYGNGIQLQHPSFRMTESLMHKSALGSVLNILSIIFLVSLNISLAHKDTRQKYAYFPKGSARHLCCNSPELLCTMASFYRLWTPSFSLAWHMSLPSPTSWDGRLY